MRARGERRRLQHRLDGCRAIVDRLRQEGALRPGLDPAAAADLLWTMTSLRTWEDLVLRRGWTAGEYETRIGESLLASLTAPQSARKGDRHGDQPNRLVHARGAH